MAVFVISDVWDLTKRLCTALFGLKGALAIIHFLKNEHNAFESSGSHLCILVVAF